MSSRTKQILFLSFVFFVIVSVSGCKTLQRSVVVHDELFTYDVSFDKAYLTVIDALGNIPGWKLAMTDKRAGVIEAIPTNLMHGERVKIILKKIDKTQTSVELAQESQTAKGVEAVLKGIDKALLA